MSQSVNDVSSGTGQGRKLAPLQVGTYTGARGQSLRFGKLQSPVVSLDDEGDILLYVPGLGGSVKGALHFLSGLQDRFSTIYAPDLRGFGLNSETMSVTSVADTLEDLDCFWEQHLNPLSHRNIYLCGISLGASLSVHLVNQYPQRFESLVLLAPAYKPSPVTFSTAYVLSNLMRSVFGGKDAQTVLPYGIEEITRNPLIRDDPQYKVPPLSLPTRYLFQVRSLNLKAFRTMANLSLPTLMVVPQSDVVCCPHTMQKAFLRIPQETPSHLVTYSQMYHDVLMEPEVDEVVAEVLQWLETHSAK